MRTLTPEHLAAMQAGRARVHATRSRVCPNIIRERTKLGWRYGCSVDPAHEWYESPCDSQAQCRYLSTTAIPVVAKSATTDGG